jgi:hypothetical protein
VTGIFDLIFSRLKFQDDLDCGGKSLKGKNMVSNIDNMRKHSKTRFYPAILLSARKDWGEMLLPLALQRR